MKRTGLTLLSLFLFCLSTLPAQTNVADEAYIKAMTANDPGQRAQLLKDFVAKYAGKGSQYENFAYANLCLTPYPGKTPREIIDYGEKAIALGGLDDLTKCQVCIQLSAVYSDQGQSLEKAKTYAGQVVEISRGSIDKEPGSESATQWTKMMGAGYFAQGQAQEKARDLKGAVDSYLHSYNILKNPQIAASLKKTGKLLYDAKDYINAEKALKAAHGALKDVDSLSLYARALYKNGKQDEALASFKELYAKQKSGEMAYNIGIILAKKASSSPALAPEAIRYLLEASFLYPGQSQQAMQMAESLFFTTNKELKYNETVKEISARNKKIDELTQTYNSKFEGKDEEELSEDDKKEMKSLLDNIEVEKKAIQKLEADQKLAIDKFNKLLEETKLKLGVKS